MSEASVTMKSMDITLLQPAGLVVSPAFSHVAIVPPGASTVYVGGQNGVDETGAVVSPEIGEQASAALDNAQVALAAAGASLDDVVSWTVYFHADADVRTAYGVIAPRLARSGPPPLVTAARVSGLGVPGALIEISAVAAVISRQDLRPGIDEEGATA
jgi:enamine deaminase RidA (YjgF/YER057c/UK114 family)